MVRKADLIDVPERRSVPFTAFEVRASGSDARIEGYASIFDKKYPIYGGPEAGGFDEFVNRGAFRRTLSENPDVVLLENHTGGPLARTKSGTLQLSTDSTGLISSATLDLRDPQAKSVFVKMDRGDYDEMSFAFRVKAQTWSDGDTVRALDEVSLHKGDVSIVNFGANPHTSVALQRALKRFARGELDDRELAELRALLIGRTRGRALSAMADGDGLEDDDSEDPGGSLAQAVHDLCADAGADCNPAYLRSSRRARRSGNLTVAEAEMIGGSVLSGRRGNLTVSQAARMCR